MRTQLVEATIRLLREEGPSAVQARRLAREIGASTMAVYTHFGGMPELLRAVRTEGLRQLDIRLGEVPVADDPVTHICVMAFAYRALATENPHLYDVMFGIATPGGHRAAEPEDDESFATASSFRHLVDAAARAIAAGRLTVAEPLQVAAQLWSCLHGFVTLELAGDFRPLPDPVGMVLAPMAINLMVGMGDTRAAAENSAAAVVSFVEPAPSS
jgi:AcrR family transcriptional regulator